MIDNKCMVFLFVCFSGREDLGTGKVGITPRSRCYGVDCHSCIPFYTADSAPHFAQDKIEWSWSLVSARAKCGKFRPEVSMAQLQQCSAFKDPLVNSTAFNPLLELAPDAGPLQEGGKVLGVFKPPQEAPGRAMVLSP